MAIMIPSQPHLLALSGANRLRAELAVRFEKELPKEYRVFHRPYLNGTLPDHVEFGTFDFLILADDGSLLLVLVVENGITQDETGVTSPVGNHNERPAQLAKRGLRWIHHALARDTENENLYHSDFLLYFPDTKVTDAARKAIGIDRVIDQANHDTLIERIQALLTPPAKNTVQPVVDIDECGRQIGVRLRSIESIHTPPFGPRQFVSTPWDPLQLAHDLRMTPRRIRLRAAAGAGKTTFGAQRFLIGAKEHKRALYLSDDALLTARLNALSGSHGKALSWFEFVGRFLDEVGFPRPDFAQVGEESSVWEELADELFESTVPQNWRFDTIVIDEGHSFRPPWWHFLRGFIGPETEVIWLEDYRLGSNEAPHTDLKRYVQIDANISQRTPWRIARFIHDVTGQPLATANPLPGYPVYVRGYKDPGEQIDIVIREIARLQRDGFSYNDIAIVTFGDAKNSAFANTEHLGEIKLREIDKIQADKSILFVSLDRFCGHEAPAVILVDVKAGISATDAHAVHLYLAATRATVALTVVALTGNPLTKVLLGYNDGDSSI